MQRTVRFSKSRIHENHLNSYDLGLNANNMVSSVLSVA